MYVDIQAPICALSHLPLSFPIHTSLPLKTANRKSDSHLYRETNPTKQYNPLKLALQTPADHHACVCVTCRKNYSFKTGIPNLRSISAGYRGYLERFCHIKTIILNLYTLKNKVMCMYGLLWWARLSHISNRSLSVPAQS